jgi:hypothetical protein
MLFSPRDPWRDNRLAPGSVPSRKILNRAESSIRAVARRCAMRSAHSGSAECGVTSQRWQNESLAAPFGAARLSMIVASGCNRGRPGMRRGALDTLYCGENNDFIAECERADRFYRFDDPAYADRYRS